VAIICVMLAFVGFLAMRNIARAVASEKLKNLTYLAFAAVIADSVLTMAIYFFATDWHNARNFLQNNSTIMTVDLCSSAVFAAFGWYWLKAAAIIREKHAINPVTLPPMPPAHHYTQSPEEKVSQFLARRTTPKL
jgi:hypothetical protein